MLRLHTLLPLFGPALFFQPVVLGLLLDFSPKLFSWFGRLPGDIRIQGENSFFFFPITSMIVVSLVLTLLFNLFVKK